MVLQGNADGGHLGRAGVHAGAASPFPGLPCRRPRATAQAPGHLAAFPLLAESLILELQVGRGAAIRCVLGPESEAEFEALLASGKPALFGTFHFGASDLLGYLLGERGRRVSIIRLRVANSNDTRLLGRRYSERVSFLWINDPRNLLFELKAAIEAGESLALKCDRVEFSARTEPFDFLGRRRMFPFTIYHLAVLFDRPVVFCMAVLASGDELRLIASPVFTPDPRPDAMRTRSPHGPIFRPFWPSWKHWFASTRCCGSTSFP